MPAMTVALFLALIWQVVDFAKELTTPASRKGAITQATAWGVGIAGVALGAHAALTADVVIPGTTLPMHALDAGSVVFAGLLVASAASSVVDLKQAIDSSDSAAKPPLVKG